MDVTQQEAQSREGLPTGGFIDSAIAKEEALKKFKQINWSDFTRAGAFSLTTREVSLFKDIEMSLSDEEIEPRQIERILSESGHEFCKGLLKLLKNITDPTVVKFALARCEDLLQDRATLVQRIAYFCSEDGTFDASPFLRLVKASHGYAEQAASKVLALVLSVKNNEHDIENLLDWIVGSLNLGPSATLLSEPARAGSARAAISTLMVLLRTDRSRELFVAAAGLPLLADILKNCQGRAQLSYELCFCLWTLTYSDQALYRLESSGAIVALVNQVMAAPREKVVRVALAALRNLIGKQDGIFHEAMIEAGLLKQLSHMKQRKWTDEDIADDVNAIHDVLFSEFKTLTTFERYQKEILSEKLSWGILHTEKFWRENVMAFEAKEFDLIKMLIVLLSSDDPLVVSVALYDLGEFVRYYPNGKSILRHLGAQSKVMKLMTHEDPSVQKHALQCVSKMMVNKWEYVRTPSFKLFIQR